MPAPPPTPLDIWSCSCTLWTVGVLTNKSLNAPCSAAASWPDGASTSMPVSGPATPLNINEPYRTEAARARAAAVSRSCSCALWTVGVLINKSPNAPCSATSRSMPVSGPAAARAMRLLASTSPAAPMSACVLVRASTVSACSVHLGSNWSSKGSALETAPCATESRHRKCAAIAQAAGADEKDEQTRADHSRHGGGARTQEGPGSCPAARQQHEAREQPDRPERARTATAAGWGSARAKGYRRPSPNPGRRACARAAGAETATRPGSRPSPFPSRCPPS